MDIKTAIAMTPWLRRIWKWVPGPLKIPVLLIGALVAFWYVATGRHKDGEQEGGETGPGQAQ